MKLRSPTRCDAPLLTVGSSSLVHMRIRKEGQREKERCMRDDASSSILLRFTYRQTHERTDGRTDGRGRTRTLVWWLGPNPKRSRRLRYLIEIRERSKTALTGHHDSFTNLRIAFCGPLTKTGKLMRAIPSRPRNWVVYPCEVFL